MLISNLYSVIKSDKINNENIKIQIELNPKHPIFEGHFPGNPIMPGVCMMQIIKELTEDFLQKEVQLSKVSNVKFMATINPFLNPILELDLNIIENENEIKVKNSSFFDKTTALKFSAIFINKTE